VLEVVEEGEACDGDDDIDVDAVVERLDVDTTEF